MTHIITGPAGSGKTAALYELLKNDSKSRILLVPDQFVFEMIINARFIIFVRD